MKAGDKLICKTNHYYPALELGKEYVIDSIDNGDDYYGPKIHIIDDNSRTRIFKDNKNSVSHIWDFFFTTQELREFKLNKIGICLLK